MKDLHARINAVETSRELDLPTKIGQLTQLYFSSPSKGPDVLTQKEVATLMLSIENLARQELLKQRG